MLDSKDIQILTDILKKLPQIETSGNRENLLFITGLSLYITNINLNGDAENFAIHLINTLVIYGSIPNGQNSLGMLLKYVKTKVGIEKQQEIETIIVKYKLEINQEIWQLNPHERRVILDISLSGEALQKIFNSVYPNKLNFSQVNIRMEIFSSLEKLVCKEYLIIFLEMCILKLDSQKEKDSIAQLIGSICNRFDVDRSSCQAKVQNLGNKNFAVKIEKDINYENRFLTTCMLYNKNKTIKIPSQETSCEMEEIKKFLPIKIAENAEQIEMIEFFLPMECFDWRVDLWEVEEEPIFFYRSLVIRSLERNYLNHHKLAAKYWKEKWNACYTELTYSNTYVADEKLDKTKMIEKNVVGGIFCSTNDFCKTVKTTLITGIPIALYTQSEKLSLQNVLNELEGGTFHNLPIKIQKLKIQNREAWKDVILLWDNPLQRPGEHNE